MAMMKARKPKRYAGGGSIDRANDATMMKDPHGIFRGIEKATDMVVPGGFSRVFRMTTYKDEDAVKREAEAAAMLTSEAAAKPQGNMKRGGPVKEVKSGRKVKKPQKIEKVMKEFKEGSLKSSSGDKVKNRKQAVAIALSEASRMSEGGKVKPQNPELWSSVKSQAKSKFDVYPSAYANAWASKEYKKKGGSWKGPDNRVSKK